MTQFVIDLASKGVSRRPLRDMMDETDFSEITFDDVFVPDAHVMGKAGEGWALVTRELVYERSGPERFLSNLPLLVAAAGTGEKGPMAAREVGRLVARLGTLRQMSMAVAGMLESGAAPHVEAAIVKDMGNIFERDLPGALRRVFTPRPNRDGSLYETLLAEAILQAPSITLRGGTPEILRGVIAKGLGLR
jgi:hypothetical protein